MLITRIEICKTLLLWSILLSPHIAYQVIHCVNQNYVTLNVEKKELSSNSVSSTYLVFTKDETFENTNSIALFKFNSSDIYDQIKKGKTYRAKVSGVFVPIISRYRNIIEIQEQPK